MLFCVHIFDINAPKIPCRHVLVILQISERLLDIASINLQVYLLCRFYYYPNEKTVRNKKSIRALKFYQNDHASFVNHYQKRIYFRPTSFMPHRKNLQNFRENVSIGRVWKNIQTYQRINLLYYVTRQDDSRLGWIAAR